MNYIFALGFFDGVHLGHQALLAQARLLAGERYALGAITFDAHPQSPFSSRLPALLSAVEDRQALLQAFGVEKILTLPATAEFMATPWQDFLQLLLNQGAVGFVCGDDFRFGAKGAGTPALLMDFCRQGGLPCGVVPEQKLDGLRISSSHIRLLLEAGDLEGAEKFLGHRHRLTGTVVHGQGLGRTLGTPTANLSVAFGVLLPRHGVYACRAWVGAACYAAVTNIGTRPTVRGAAVTVEPWLLDFEGDLYGKQVTLEFVKFLRPEQRFESLEELKAAILENARQTRELIP